MCLLKTSDLGNDAGVCLLDLKVKSILMSWGLVGCIVIIKLHLPACYLLDL